jgi:Mg/Co/Ni transporter MgtE
MANLYFHIPKRQSAGSMITTATVRVLRNPSAHLLRNKVCKQEFLIGLLNTVVVGWVNYYKYCVTSYTCCLLSMAEETCLVANLKGL